MRRQLEADIQDAAETRRPGRDQVESLAEHLVYAGWRKVG